MKFAKHLAKAMRLSDPEWLPFWVNYRFLKKILPSKSSLMSPAAPVAPVAPAAPASRPTVVVASESTPTQNSAEAASIPAATAKSDSSIISLSSSSAGDAPSALHSAGQGGRGQHVKSKTPVVPAVGYSSARADGRGRPCQRQPSGQYITRLSFPPSSPVESTLVSTGGNTITETFPPLPWQEEANAKLAAERRNDRVVGSSNVGSDGTLGQRKVAPTSGKRKALGATTTSHRAPVFTRPTCCSRPLSGCTKAAITMAAAMGFCPPASLASHSAPSAPHTTARCKDERSWQRQRQSQQEQQPREQQPWQLQQTQFTHHQQLQRRQQYEIEKGREDVGGDVGKWTTRTSPPSSSTPVLLCPFYSMLLREIYKCRVFFLENENDLKARTTRLQFALNQLKNPELSRLSTVKGFHVKLMQACLKFYRDALLLEDFAMVNYTAVIKLLKKRDKLTGASDQTLFMEKVMAAQPFAMYPGVAERVAEVEEIFREIEDMCFLRTGAGMKSVMKTELTVVEAILQLAQESEDTQTRVLYNKDTAGPPMSPGSFRRLSLLKGHIPGHVSGGGNCGDSPKGTVMPVACPEKGDGSSRAPGEIPPPSKVGRLTTRTPVPTPLQAGGNGNPTGVSEQGRGGTCVLPTSVRVFVNPRGPGPHEVKEDEKHNEVVVSVTGVVVSATKTPRLSTNAPRLAVTTAGFGRGIMPKSRLG